MRKYALFLAVLFITHSAFAYPCAQPKEMEAIRIRALQTELMMAGLSCNGQRHYNRFVKNYRSELKQYARALRSYFVRGYGDDAENEMNQFVTQLANQSSRRSLQNGAKSFCSDASGLFQTVSASKKLNHADFDYRGDIKQCF